jgi:hypothetical protein
LTRRDADDELADALAEIYAEAGQPTAADRADIRAADPSLTVLSPS